MNPAKATYIERITGWLMPDQRDPDLATEARENTTLDGVYSDKSSRIFRLMQLAYLRGVRRGASSAWDAAQPLYGSFFALWLCSCDDRAPTCLRSGYRPRRNTKRMSQPPGPSPIPAPAQTPISGVIIRTVQLPKAR